jgi:hypothetical protein
VKVYQKSYTSFFLHRSGAQMSARAHIIMKCGWLWFCFV